MPGLKALQYVVPRTCYQFAKACGGGHLKDFIRAMKSARQLMPRLLEQRRPLQAETFHRIGAMKQGLVP